MTVRSGQAWWLGRHNTIPALCSTIHSSKHARAQGIQANRTFQELDHRHAMQIRHHPTPGDTISAVIGTNLVATCRRIDIDDRIDAVTGS